MIRSLLCRLLSWDLGRELEKERRLLINATKAKNVGATKGGLVALQLLPNDMPPIGCPIGFMERLFA